MIQSAFFLNVCTVHQYVCVAISFPPFSRCPFYYCFFFFTVTRFHLLCSLLFSPTNSLSPPQPLFFPPSLFFRHHPRHPRSDPRARHAPLIFLVLLFFFFLLIGLYTKHVIVCDLPCRVVLGIWIAWIFRGMIQYTPRDAGNFLPASHGMNEQTTTPPPRRPV